MEIKDIQKKTVDMYNLLTTLQQMEQMKIDNPDQAEDLNKKAEGLKVNICESLMYGIVAKDLITELDKNADLGVAFHGAGFENGINEEFFRRVKVLIKKINKLNGRKKR